MRYTTRQRLYDNFPQSKKENTEKTKVISAAPCKSRLWLRLTGLNALQSGERNANDKNVVAKIYEFSLQHFTKNLNP